MSCSTCFPTTQFGWVTEFSGKDEAEIVAAAGEGACTVCYPSAPVLPGTRTIWHADDVAAQAARAERQVKAEAAAAKKAANTIEPVRVKGYRVIETVHAAKAFLTDVAEQRIWVCKDEESVAKELIVALRLAEKLGTTVEAELAAATKRAKNR